MSVMVQIQSFTCQIDNQGRLLLPSQIRRSLSLNPGSEVVVTLREDRVSVQTPQQALRGIQERLAKRVPAGVSLADELIQERRREAAHED